MDGGPTRYPPEPCRLAAAEPLRCFDEIEVPATAPPLEGFWSWRSPRPLRPGDEMSVRAAPARGPRRGTVLLVPPWQIASAELVSGWSAALRRCRWDVWLVCPPLHLERTEPGARSGRGFVTLDLPRFRAVLEQFVLEIRTCARMAAGSGPVGLVGLSLGALAGALASTGPDRLDFAALVAPPHLPLVLAQSDVGRRYRRLATRAGSDWPGDEAVTAALSPLDPALRRPTAARVLVAAGVHDAIAPAAGPVRLARAWGVEPALYPRGHITVLFLCGSLRRDVARFAGAAHGPARCDGGTTSAAWLSTAASPSRGRSRS